MAKLKALSILIIVAGIFCFGVFSFVSASNTGTIDSTDKYAWSENAGWINFGTTQGNVTVTDSELTGYAWLENLGWISLNCSNNSTCSTVDYKVSNDGNKGRLSGYAWGENAGWINFNSTSGRVTINSSGEFTGYAWGENTGWISFNCSNNDTCSAVNYKVKTDHAIITGSSGGPSYLPPTITLPPTPPPTSTPTPTPTPITTPLTTSQLQNEIQRIQNQIKELTAQLNPSPATALSVPPIIFSQDLKLGIVASNVKALQQFLNNNGVIIAQTGPGSIGKETNIFGTLTKQALIKFQETYKDQILKPLGLTKGTGFFGPSTRAFINSLIK